MKRSINIIPWAICLVFLAILALAPNASAGEPPGSHRIFLPIMPR